MKRPVAYASSRSWRWNRAFGNRSKFPDMVVMQMSEDNVLDRRYIDVERAERLHRTAQERPLPLLRYFRVEASVDDEGAAASPRQPHEIVHRHRAVVRIAADEMIAAPRIAGGIADGEQLVFLIGHAISRTDRSAHHFASTSLNASRAFRKASIPDGMPQYTPT